jgi:hypothetical protein
MKSTGLIAVALVVALAAGCGDDDDGGDDDVANPDAAASIDAPGGGGPDAAGGDIDAAGGGPDGGGDDAKNGAFCGGFGGLTCERSEWCDYVDGCGFDDGGGECKPRPESCIEIFDPVCGCDRVTYSNECIANLNGQDVLFEGTCRDGG